MKRSAELPRRRIYELITLYQFESNLRDIYVEGPFDRSLYSWFMKAIGINAVTVHEIDEVDVPGELLLKLGLNSCARSRVEALAVSLTDLDPSIQKRISCIVDADFDYIMPSKRNGGPCLFMTDYTSAELYCFTQEVLEKFLTLALGQKEPSRVCKHILRQLGTELRKVFLLRLTVRELQFDMTWQSIKHDLKADKSGNIIFKFDTFLDRYLIKNAMLKKKQEIIAKMQELEALGASVEDRRAVHGHDSVLGLAITQKSRGRPINRRTAGWAAQILIPFAKQEIMHCD